jgi:membrane protease YdiL (CAAX protease family)
VLPQAMRSTQGFNQRRLAAACTLALMVIFQLPLAGRIYPGDTLAAQLGREAVFWALTAGLIAYVLLFERRPLASLCLRSPTWKSLGIGVAAAAVMFAGIAMIYVVVFPALGLSSNPGGLSAIKELPLWLRIMLVIRAASFEELFYRGFMIERLSEITGRRWLAAIISLGAFSFAHLGYWGWAHLIVAGFGGALLTGLYLWRRDLAANMIAHFFTDAIAFLIA